MAREKLLYIERSTGANHNGEAWITRARQSKSGRTTYFNGKALKSQGGSGVSGNYYDLETNEEYWISGVKKRFSNRHWAGRGLIMVDSRVLEEFLKLRNLSKLDPKYYKVVQIEKTNISRLHDLENVSG